MIPNIVEYILFAACVLIATLFIYTVSLSIKKAWEKRKIRKNSDLPFFDDKNQRKEIGRLGREIRQREGIRGFNIFRNMCIVTWMSRLYNLELGFDSDWNAIDYLIELGEEKPSTEYLLKFIPYQLSPDFGMTREKMRTLKPHDTLKIVHEKYIEGLKEYYLL
jgi:hypothetical protein